MTEHVFARAKETFERLPSPDALERAVAILARGGVPLPRIRSWARDIAGLHGVLPYVRDFEGMMIGAAKLAERARADAA